MTKSWYHIHFHCWLWIHIPQYFTSKWWGVYEPFEDHLQENQVFSEYIPLRHDVLYHHYQWFPMLPSKTITATLNKQSLFFEKNWMPILLNVINHISRNYSICEKLNCRSYIINFPRKKSSNLQCAHSERINVNSCGDRSIACKESIKVVYLGCLPYLTILC